MKLRKLTTVKEISAFGGKKQPTQTQNKKKKQKIQTHKNQQPPPNIWTQSSKTQANLNLST